MVRASNVAVKAIQLITTEARVHGVPKTSLQNRKSHGSVDYDVTQPGPHVMHARLSNPSV